MSITQVIDTILTRPIVHIAYSGRDTGMTASYSFRPLSNLIYTRDQQITTCKGIVMARLRSLQRHDEVAVMEHVLTKIGKARNRWERSGGVGVANRSAATAPCGMMDIV